MDAAILSLLRGEMERLGYKPAEDGLFHLRPEQIPFTAELWGKLCCQSAPLLETETWLPAVRETYLEDLAYRLTKSEAMQKAWWKEGMAPFQVFLSENVRLADGAEVWLDIPVRVDLGLTVDDLSDYTLNVTYPAYEGAEYDIENKGRFDRSSIMWLTRRQGYKQAQLRDALYKVRQAADLADPYRLIPSRYLYSAAREIWHELSIYNQLGFFLLLPLRELLLLNSMKLWGEDHKKWPGYVLLDKSVRCGFFCTWNGSCSLLGIQLEKDVKLPLRDLRIIPDGGDGYSLYGVCEDPSVWQPDRILHWGLPRQFRRDAAVLGFHRLPPKGPFSGEPIDNPSPVL